jgi:hypothetical protein
MFATTRTRIVDVATAVADTCFFRRRLKQELYQVRQELAETHCQWQIQKEVNENYRVDEMSARALLMQLRVHQESVRGRTGFMVSAFVPTDVLERLQKGSPQQRLNFQMRVSKVLVEHALKGMFRVTSKGTMTAMIFEPLGPKSNKRIVSALFETKDGQRVIESPATSPDVRAIRDAQQRQLNGTDEWSPT